MYNEWLEWIQELRGLFGAAELHQKAGIPDKVEGTEGQEHGWAVRAEGQDAGGAAAAVETEPAILQEQLDPNQLPAQLQFETKLQKYKGSSGEFETEEPEVRTNPGRAGGQDPPDGQSNSGLWVEIPEIEKSQRKLKSEFFLNSKLIWEQN